MMGEYVGVPQRERILDAGNSYESHDPSGLVDLELGVRREERNAVVTQRGAAGPTRAFGGEGQSQSPAIDGRDDRQILAGHRDPAGFDPSLDPGLSMGVLDETEDGFERRINLNTQTYIEASSSHAVVQESQARRLASGCMRRVVPDPLRIDERPLPSRSQPEPMFNKRLQDTYDSKMYATKEGAVQVNLASLQQVNLMRLRRMLAQEALEFRYKVPKNQFRYEESTVMHDYVMALRDWEYIKKHASHGRTHDPFILTTTERTDDRDLIKDAIGKIHDELQGTSVDAKPVGIDPKIKEDLETLDTSPTRRMSASNTGLFEVSRTRSNRNEDLKGLVRRVAIALLGGSFLIVPMLIMVLNEGRVTALLTTLLFVIAFGTVISLFLERLFDILSGTAAYAAVLVVFIGTNSE